ncbi:hypothetical protein [Actinomadura sp. 3N407]|uniref:hypothetical protein n=1 Tax=Actinomadura sp. 3N407 TaxID=3457423 RepID=UPI003FCCEB0E
MRVLAAGATGVVGRQADACAANAGQEACGMARDAAGTGDVEIVDALDRDAVHRAARSVLPERALADRNSSITDLMTDLVIAPSL